MPYFPKLVMVTDGRAMADRMSRAVSSLLIAKLVRNLGEE
jgi:hypothetical protein